MSTNAMQSGTPAQKPSANDTATTDKSALLAEIGAKWDKFSPNDIEGFRTSEQLTQGIVDKYGLPRADAQRDVDTLLAGRAL